MADARPPGGGREGAREMARTRPDPNFATGEQQFRMLVDGVVDYAIYMLDPLGYVASWNAGAERITGYAAREIIGRHFSTFYTEEDRAAGEPSRALATAANRGKYEKEGWRVRKDGSRFWASVVIDPIYDAERRLIGFAKVTRDMTERRKAEESLTAAQAALFQSQKMELVGQLTAGIAHDFNNVLTVIVNALDALSRPSVEEQRKRRLVEGARRAAERGAELTQQLLAFSRKQPLHPKPNHVNRMIAGFEAVLRRACGDLVEMRFQLEPRLPGVLVDSTQFESSLLNLMINARDAMPFGGRITVATGFEVRVHADASPGFPAGQWVWISVKAEGTGMTEEARSLVLKSFFAAQDHAKGFGLGLSQVFGFFTQSGGHVRVDDCDGKGVRVSLYLPAHGEMMVVTAPSAPRSDASTVLVVEDDADTLYSAVDMLRSVGYSVLTAPDAVGALDVLQRGLRVDVLFTDIVMPNGLNGVELARAATKLRPSLRVLLASGYPQASLSSDFGLTDEFPFIAKPYRWSEVIDRLRGSVPAGG